MKAPVKPKLTLEDAEELYSRQTIPGSWAWCKAWDLVQRLKLKSARGIRAFTSQFDPASKPPTQELGYRIYGQMKAGNEFLVTKPQPKKRFHLTGSEFTVGYKQRLYKLRIESDEKLGFKGKDKLPHLTGPSTAEKGTDVGAVLLKCHESLSSYSPTPPQPRLENEGVHSLLVSYQEKEFRVVAWSISKSKSGWEWDLQRFQQSEGAK